MTITYSPLFFPLLAWLFSCLGTALTLPLLRRYDVIDEPNERSNHTRRVPRGGGMP